MDIQTREQCSIIGIAVRTTNEDQQSGKDIPALWEQFISEGVAARIPNKTGHSVYCVYTDYEKDHTKPYTTLLGCAVFSLEDIPEGLLGRTFEGANYIKFVATGDLQQGVVFDEWVKIWNADLPRAFTADFEVYGEQAQDPAHAAVDIFIAVK
jgi:predicted transcriptional regulator YdeE